MIPKEDIRVLISMLDGDVRQRIETSLLKMGCRVLATDCAKLTLAMGADANIILCGNLDTVERLRANRIWTPTVIINGIVDAKRAQDLKLAKVVSRYAPTKEIYDTIRSCARVSSSITGIRKSSDRLGKYLERQSKL